MTAAENGNATCLPGEPRTHVDDVSDRMMADAITCSRHGCTAAWSSMSSKSCRKKGQSPTSVTGRRTRLPNPQVLSSHHRLCRLKRRGGRWECRRAYGAERERPSFWPSTRPHGGGGCSHQLAAQVHVGTVIKLLLIAFKTKKKTSASMR